LTIRGKVVPYGRILNPSFTPRGNTLFSLEERRGGQSIFTLGVNLGVPRGQLCYLGRNKKPATIALYVPKYAVLHLMCSLVLKYLCYFTPKCICMLLCAYLGMYLALQPCLNFFNIKKLPPYTLAEFDLTFELLLHFVVKLL
jgi:hypothetical protein